MTTGASKTNGRKKGMKENNRRTFGRAAWGGKAVLFCLGVLAMVALVVVVAVLAAVMLADTVLPSAVTGHERNPGTRRSGGNTPRRSPPRKTVVSRGQPGR